jgi:hypothetical protein
VNETRLLLLGLFGRVAIREAPFNVEHERVRWMGLQVVADLLGVTEHGQERLAQTVRNFSKPGQEADVVDVQVVVSFLRILEPGVPRDEAEGMAHELFSAMDEVAQLARDLKPETAPAEAAN